MVWMALGCDDKLKLIWYVYNINIQLFFYIKTDIMFPNICTNVLDEMEDIWYDHTSSLFPHIRCVWIRECSKNSLS